MTKSTIKTPIKFKAYSLGRRYEHDPRNLDFPMRALLPRIAYEKPITKIWNCKVVLDQGQEGSCVGHGFAHELIADPYPILGINHNSAVKIYKKAKTLDAYPGTNYSGTSVLAGVKATQKLYKGTIESYRWANNVADVVATLGYHGPVVLGVNWYSAMYKPGSDGFIRAQGDVVGGHCLLARGVGISKNAILLQNSWGYSWGNNGTCWISFDDLDRLIHERGEACVIVNRGWWIK